MFKHSNYPSLILFTVVLYNLNSFAICMSILYAENKEEVLSCWLQLFLLESWHDLSMCLRIVAPAATLHGAVPSQSSAQMASNYS